MKLKYLTYGTFCSLFLCSVTLHAQISLAAVEGGEISGVLKHDISVFKGIPFAAPPVGDLRWKAPQPVLPWTGTKACTEFGASPMQAEPRPFSMWSAEFLIPEKPISEDCLYLNVWTAAKKATEKRPVLVWIYGGGFVSGGANVPIYDGEALAKKGIIFVSLNYRVGPFGFFAHPELSKESGKNASGNYGLMDQIAGIAWVKKNIAAFGGDPEQITIAGQSAGAMSVNLLVASPLAKGLFNKAIAESGASFARENMPLPQAEKEGVRIASTLNATSLEQLRAIPAKELLTKAQSTFRPIIDGYVVDDHVANTFAENKQNPVVLLTGWNESEGLIFEPTRPANAYKAQISAQYGTEAQKMLAFYPATNEEVATKSQYNLARDMIFGRQNYAWAIEQSKHARTYVYYFRKKVPGRGDYAKYGAFHTGEVPYVMNNLAFSDRPWTAQDRQLADKLSSYWVNFVKTGNPNGKGLTDWPAFSVTSKNVLLLDTTLKAAPLPTEKNMKFLIGKMN
jgi:para-nitrobenzyl esterase